MAPMLGTGGVPNLRIVEDYAPSGGPSHWFEVHAAIEIPAQTAQEIRDALARKDLETVVNLVMTRGTLTIPMRNGPDLRKLLSALYWV
jgi:hypothetical protein